MQSTMSSDEAAFMTMLDEADISVTSRWADVQRKLAKDARFQAIVGEQKISLFRSYVRMRQEVDCMRLDSSEREFMVCSSVLCVSAAGCQAPRRR